MTGRRAAVDVRARTERTVVVVRRALTAIDVEAFEAAMGAAVGAGEPRVELDLRRASELPLPVLAVVLRARRQLVTAGRALHVRSPDRVADGFRAVAVSCKTPAVESASIGA